MSADYFNSPRALLAVAFPPQQGLRGACAAVQDLARPAYRIPRLMSRREALRLAIARNLESFADGQGNRAKRRVAALRKERAA